LRAGLRSERARARGGTFGKVGIGRGAGRGNKKATGYIAIEAIDAALDEAARPEGRLRLGTALAEMSWKIGLTNADIGALDQTQDTKPAEPFGLE
jgi:hypothetical protein